MADMSVSKQKIKEFCKKRYVEPARARGDSHVTIRSSEVLEAFGLDSGNSTICEALWSVEFELENNLFRVSSSCQKSSDVAIMVYRVLPMSPEE